MEDVFVVFLLNDRDVNIICNKVYEMCDIVNVDVMLNKSEIELIGVEVVCY